MIHAKSPTIGSTRADFVALLGVVALSGIVVIPLCSRIRDERQAGAWFSDSSQLRGVMQAMTGWANIGDGSYPLPSTLDASNATVASEAHAKNTTANIFSVLVFNELITPEMLVSRVERGNVRALSGYQYKRPSSAVDPTRALWDPALSADFTKAQGANVSYSHLQPDLARLSRWRNTFDRNVPVMSNRGPHITGVSPSIAIGNPGSLTLTNGGWKGNVAYSDNHMSFEDGYGDPADNRFFDEPTDPANAYLGIFTKAGKNASDFTAIWD